MTKILIIEDATDLRNDVIEMLALEGYEALGAENGRVGLVVAKQEHPDLIICDIMMPELDGYGVLEALREDPRTATIPFIFLTAKTDRFDMRHGMVLGADDYLTKPFLVNELLDSIRAQLDKRLIFKQRAEEKLAQLRENIMSALPHELRTPLNTIIGFSEMLMSECQRLKPDQIADWSQHIHGAALRLYRLVENHIFYARVESIARAPEELARFRRANTENAAATVAIYANRRANQLGRADDIIIETAASGIVPLSDSDLGKIVEELVDNAFKFCDDEHSKVTVRATSDAEHFTLVVQDDGRGMQPEQVNAIGAFMQFDRFLYEQQGSGLGLAIIQRLVSLVGGQLTFDTELGRGTTVYVRLPLIQQISPA